MGGGKVCHHHLHVLRSLRVAGFTGNMRRILRRVRMENLHIYLGTTRLSDPSCSFSPLALLLNLDYCELRESPLPSFVGFLLTIGVWSICLCKLKGAQDNKVHRACLHYEQADSEDVNINGRDCAITFVASYPDCSCVYATCAGNL